ncbi:Glycosyltransferase involved in cell wall bisynthesis [Micromonospora rhizosphaerae]|uniref:Glycosyltransferase involved in cell wall bisynthesis n=1 Tax=Micromonospora rhizosphaerae TaxID=568872 RepID=A0A1C6SX16_9ACTN|nr:glycosyltransferase family 2 protein [Micromonospora rhizosphaerae]SCL34106.1 Glycosyltransferase involved in cell wall bisynthesis [Micromonospora rhizosphaerae]
MPSTDVLVSICLPVRNGASRLEPVVQSILAQDHADLELIISDNASSDGTEDVCRALAAADRRIAYHRQPENIGLLNNFIAAMRLARGTFIRWVGDDDWLAPNCLSQSLEVLAADQRLILVTMGMAYVGDDGVTETADYRGRALASDDPIERFTEMLRLLNDSHLLIDPLYGLMRREAIMSIPRRNMLREDQIFAAKLALAGPWGHVHEVLGRRGWRDESRPVLARRLGVPAWTARAATMLQGCELLRWVRQADLDPDQRRRARKAVLRWYVGRQQLTMSHRARRLAGAARLGARRGVSGASGPAG